MPDSGASTRVYSDGTRKTQPDLPFATGVDSDTRWTALLATIRDVVDEIGLKQCAFDLDVSPSQLSHALNERERHHVPARWLVYLVTRSRHDDLPLFFASLRGLDLVARPVISPEEELRRLKEAMAECLGADVREVIARKVRR
jgi:hypothetical protein